jgi:iron complex outermembrane receptor protein
VALGDEYALRSRVIHFTVVVLLAALGAGAVELRVAATDGSALAGARITVVGRGGWIVADRDGRATLSPEPAVPFVLVVARPDGVALRPVTVSEIPTEGPLEVIVEPAGESLTVVSGAIPDLELPPAVAATVLGGADLVQRQPVRLAEALENLPGTGNSGNGQSTVPSLRGLPKHRTLILLDDARIASERRAGPSATFLDPETLDEVEVVRGPGSVAYGSDAFGGIIRARSRMPSLSGGGELRYGLSAGNVADELTASAEITNDLLGGGVLLGGQYRSFDDYTSPEGVVANSAAEDFGFRAAYQAAIGSGVLHAAWRSDLARDVGKPAPDSDLERVFYPEENSHRFNLGFERPGPGGWSRIAASVAWDTYQLVLAKDAVASADNPRRITESDVTADDYELRFEAERPLGEWRWVIGANSYGRVDLHAVERDRTLDSTGGEISSSSEVSVESARRDDVGLFSAATRDWGQWGVSAGLRGDWVRAANDGGYFGDDRVTNTGVTGFAAIRWSVLDDLEVSAQVARGFRDALLSDRYYRGPTGRGFITGNPDLEPETSRQLDLALRWSSGRWQLAGYGYLYRIEDLIERYRDGGDFYFRNRGEAEIRGVEVEGQVAVGGGLQLGFGAHWLRGRVVDDGTPTDDVPAPGGFVVLRSDPAGRWWWMARGAAFSRDERPGPTEQIVPGYGVVDAAVGFRLSPALELQLLGRNLLDNTHLASADEETVLAPGRSLRLVIRGTVGRW